MLAFPARTPLTLLQQARSTLPLPSSQLDQAQHVAKRVRFLQNKSVAAHDHRRRAAPTRIVQGDYVRIRQPRRGHKLAPVYSAPILVTAVRGNCVVRWIMARSGICVVVYVTNHRSAHRRLSMQAPSLPNQLVSSRRLLG